MRTRGKITDPTFDLLVYMTRTQRHSKTIDHAVRGLNQRRPSRPASLAGRH